MYVSSIKKYKHFGLALLHSKPICLISDIIYDEKTILNQLKRSK